MKKELSNEDPVSEVQNGKIKTYTRTAIHLKPFNARKISTRRTQVEEPKMEPQRETATVP